MAGGSSTTVGAAAALACIKESKRLKIQENATARGNQLFEGLKSLKEKYDVIGDVRGGHGLMTGMELVSNQENKTHMDAERMTKVGEKVYNSGAMVRVGGNNILLSPPLIISSSETNQILNALEEGLKVL